MIEQALLLERRELVPDGRRAPFRALGQRLRPDGHAGVEVGADDALEQLLLAGGQHAVDSRWGRWGTSRPGWLDVPGPWMLGGARRRGSVRSARVPSFGRRPAPRDGCRRPCRS